MVHVGFVVFVVLGLLLILLGGALGWRWVRGWWLRVGHLAAIGIVVVQSWLGVICPLTTLEMELRERAGDVTYQGTFVAHWLHRCLFFPHLEPWVFVVVYTLFGAAVVASWVFVRPVRRKA